MTFVFAAVFTAALLAGAVWLPWWALLPAGVLMACLLPGFVGVVAGLIERQR